MKQKPVIVITGILILIAASAFSQTDTSSDSKQKRWSGRVEFGLMGISTTSRIMGLDPDDIPGISNDFKRIDTLDKNKSYETFGSSFFLFDVNYLLNDTTSLYVGTPFYDDDREGLTAGVQKLFHNNSLLDVSLFFGSELLWEDPYLTGADRDVTESGTIGFIIDYDGISGTGLNMNYMLQAHGVKDDVSGDNNSLLDRSGFTHTLKTGYNFFLNEQFDSVLTPSITLTREAREGDAYASNGFGVELSYSVEREKNSFTMSGSAESVRYDEIHPLFNDRRSEMVYTAECYYTRKHLRDTNWYSRMGCGFNRINSSIGFFEEMTIVYGISLGYSFE